VIMIESSAPGGGRRASPACPAGRFLLHKGLFVHHDEPADKRIQTEESLATCMRHWSTLALLHRWLPTTSRPPECHGVRRRAEVDDDELVRLEDY
jgi:hypothetical protein